MSNPLSEQYRIAGKEWVELDNKARLLEESKSAVLSQRMAALGDMPVSKAELAVKASAEWHEYVREMVESRTQANLKKVQLEWLRMRFSERQSIEANERAERRM